MLAHFNRRSGLSLVGAFTFLMAMASPASAPPGDLDPTFDGDGKVTTFAGIERVNAVAIQADGKIVVAGCTACFSGSDAFALARYNSDGSLDTTFGGDGRVTADFTGAAVASAVAIQADGKIVAAGGTIVSGNADFALARYNTDGSLDTTFDGDGKVTTDFAADNDQAFGVAIQADGKIVAAGSTFVGGIGDFALARYDTDGSLDFTFDGDGKVTTDFAGVEDSASAVAIQGNQKIVVAGCTSCFPGGSDFALARYNTDGSLDATFDGDGKVTTDFAGVEDRAHAVAIQADGKIVEAGCTLCFSSGSDFALARYNTDGSLDTTFDGDGKVTTDFAAGGDVANGVAIQANGRIVAAGCTACGSSGSDFALARYNTDGSLDLIFSGDGKVTTDFAAGQDVANGVAIQADGKIVAGGVAIVGGIGDFALARYTVCRRTSRPTSVPFCP